jgi:hypothetical protein
MIFGNKNLIMEPNSYKKYEEAQKRVKKIKDFYGHIFIFLVIVPLVFIARFFILPAYGIISDEEGFNNWINWNTYIFPVMWLMAIGIHALAVFKPKPMKRWEDKKIQELIDKEKQEINKHWN